MNGGEVEFVFTGNTDQLKEKFKDTEKGLLGLTDIAEKAGETLDNMIDGDILKNLKSMGIEVGKTGAELKKALKDADEFVSGMESGLKIVIAEHAKLLSEINKMPEGNARNQLLEEYRNEAVEIEKVSNQITQYKEFLSNVKNESKSLTVKLKEVTDEMKVLYDRGEQNSARYQELTQKASEYKEAQDAVNKQVQIASGPQGFNGLINTLTFAAGGFSAVQGAIGLFGGESEDLNKIMLKVQSSLALVIGLQEIQKQLSKEGAFNITVLSRAKEIWAAMNLRVATTLGISTVAAQALTATLTLGLSVAIVGVIALLDKTSGKLKEQADFNKKVAESIAEPIIAYKNLQNQWNSLGSDLDKKKKFITDNQEAFEDLGFSVNNVGDAENFFVNKTDDVIQALTLRAKAAASLEIATEKYKEALQAQMDYEGKMNTMKNGSFFEKIWTMKDANFGTYDYFGNLIKKQNKANQSANDALLKFNDFSKQEQNIYSNGLNKFSKQEGKETKTAKTAKTTKQVAEEFLPEGSVAEIQKRLSKINELLNKSNNPSQIEALKKQRISVMAELAEAEKRIQIQSITEQVNENEKLWKQYYSAVISIGKNPADEIYKDLITESKNHISFLEKKKEELTKKSEQKDKKGNPLITEQEKEDLKFLTDKINELSGVKSPFEKLKEDIDDNISKIPNLSEQLKYLNEAQEKLFQKEGNSLYFLEANNEIEKRKSDIAKEIENRYKDFLAAQKTFEERKNAISKSYAELRQKIEADTTLNNEQKKNALEKAGQEEADAYSDAFMTELVNNPQLREAFVNLERQTTVKLLAIKQKLEESLLDKNLNPEALEKIRNDIQAINQVLAIKNPFEALTSSYNSYVKALQKGKEAESKFGKDSKEFAETQKDVESNAKSLAGAIDIVIEYGKIASDALLDVGVSIGLINEDTKQMASDIFDITQNLGKALVGVLTKDPKTIIQGVAGAIKGIANLVSGDSKKERQIKAWADQVKNLKIQYQELERAIDKALGDDKYDAQQNVIANLEKQKILLQQMIQKEKDKKKTDNGKIDDWSQQISDINAQIDDLKKSIVDDILQIDVKGLADKIGDALIEGFGRGEDALVSLNKTADDVFRQMVKNALKLQLEKQMQPIIDEMLRAMGYSNNDDALKAQIEALEKQKEALSGNAWSTLANANQITSINKLISDLKAKLGQTTGSFDGLTQEEREALKAQIIAATGDYQKAMEQYADLFGPDAANSPNGLKGDIKGMTEKTAGALESQINAIRIYQVEALNVAKRNQQIFLDALKYQAETAYNTRELKAIRIGIDDLNIKIRKGLAL